MRYMSTEEARALPLREPELGCVQPHELRYRTRGEESFLIKLMRFAC
jgi:hypothetical protein